MSFDLGKAKEAAEWMRERGVVRLHLRGPDGSELSLELDTSPLAALTEPGSFLPPEERSADIAPTVPGACKTIGCSLKATIHAPLCNVCWRKTIIGTIGAA